MSFRKIDLRSIYAVYICSSISLSCLHRQRAMVGEKTRVTHNGDQLRMNVSGMIYPRTGEAFLLEFTHSDRDVFRAFLDTANQILVPPTRKRQILICHNALWHKSKNLNWGTFEPL